MGARIDDSGRPRQSPEEFDLEGERAGDDPLEDVSRDGGVKAVAVGDAGDVMEHELFALAVGETFAELGIAGNVEEVRFPLKLGQGDQPTDIQAFVEELDEVGVDVCGLAVAVGVVAGGTEAGQQVARVEGEEVVADGDIDIGGGGLALLAARGVAGASGGTEGVLVGEVVAAEGGVVGLEALQGELEEGEVRAGGDRDGAGLVDAGVEGEAGAVVEAHEDAIRHLGETGADLLEIESCELHLTQRCG
jgi:hypothetical protein